MVWLWSWINPFLCRCIHFLCIEIILERIRWKKRTHSTFRRNVPNLVLHGAIFFCLLIFTTDSFWYILLVELAFFIVESQICVTVIIYSIASFCPLRVYITEASNFVYVFKFIFYYWQVLKKELAYCQVWRPAKTHHLLHWIAQMKI